MYLALAVLTALPYLDIVNEFVGDITVKLVKMGILLYDRPLSLGIPDTFAAFLYTL